MSKPAQYEAYQGICKHCGYEGAVVRTPYTVVCYDLCSNPMTLVEATFGLPTAKEQDAK